MTNETKQKNGPAETSSNKPGYVVKQRSGYGKKATYDRLGVAWQNDDGSLYVKLYGRQIVEGGFTLYEITGDENANG